MSRYFNQTADWLASVSLQGQASYWGWLRRGPLFPTAQVIGWSDGTSSTGGAFGWILISRGPTLCDVTLEGVGGGYAPQCDSMMAESLGFLGMSEAIKRRTQDIDTPRTWGACPAEVWTAAYARILKQLRRPTTGPWASECDSALEHLYNCQWKS